ncbi:MAG TPA: lysophospholipid acyltransferase family protein, partial [Bacteroidales bacterium]|nr:lysophospholipid acyltransferase family protein [Bacteroidales bacterium]
MTLINPDEFAKALSLQKLGLKSLAVPLMKLFRIERLNKIYQKFSHYQGIEFLDVCLGELKVSYELPPNDLKNIPAKGPVVFIANHPYGGLDGLLLIRIVAEHRPDLKVMANYILKNVKPIENYILPVDPFQRKDSTQKSLAGIKSSLEVLTNGGSLAIFPAGEVSAFHSNTKRITDKTWNPMIGRLIAKSGAKVVPIYFSGNNSLLFNLLGMIHPRLRTARLPSEILNKKKFALKIRIGKPIGPDDIAGFTDNKQLMRFLRAKTYALATSFEVKKHYFHLPLRAKATPEKIIDPVEQSLLEQEIEKIKDSDLLINFRDFDLFLSESTDIPNILREIGRLREVTFREVGEGTNRAIDIDEFDLDYHHLFIWSKTEKRIIGAYRIGKGNELFNKFGVKGFYVSTLFNMHPKMYPILRQSVELGRSFIIKEYQQTVFVLLLLWRGILTFLRRNPEYRYLIGPVSISNHFLKISKALLVHYIKQNYYDHELAKYVSAKKEFKVRLSRIDTEILLKENKSVFMKTIDDIVSELEPEGFKTPILLKKYLKQNGKIIGFNIDPK